MQKIILGAAWAVSALLLVVGLRWLIDPAAAAAELGMPLLDGVGRSSQIGDLTAFFVVAGAFGVVGLLRKQALFLYTPAALLAGAAVFRTIAWLAHGAAFAPAIVLEVVMLGVMVAAVRQLNVSDK